MHRLTLDEVGEVARLAVKRRTPAYGAGPTSHDVGAVLGLPTADVERLLDEVRRRGSSPSSPPGGSGARSFVYGVAAILALLAMIAFGALMTIPRAAKQAPNPTATAANPVDVEAPSLYSRPADSFTTELPKEPVVRPPDESPITGPEAATNVNPTVRVKSDETEMRRAANFAKRFPKNHPDG